MRVLFISRAFPPVMGGIEKQNADLAKFLAKKSELTLIANRRGKHFLPFFLPWAMLRIFWLLPRHDVLLLGDGVLAPLGFVAKCFAKKKTVVSILHGLDITFAKKKGFLACVYAHINLPSLRGLDGLICVSQETKRTAIALGLSDTRCFVVPNGIDPTEFDGSYTRSALEKLLGQDLTQRKVILRLGRFVEHKGVEWFIRNVMPELPREVLLVAAGGVAKPGMPGDQSFFPRCQRAVAELGLTDRVILLPNVSHETAQLLLHTADLAVAPNIPVPGTMEGFGISVLEASASGLPIIVSRLEGLQEAVADDENGIFAEPGSATDFVTKISTLLDDDQKRREFGKHSSLYTREHYHWDTLSERYIELLQDFQKSVTDSH